MKYGYSANEENYYGDFETREEAALEAFAADEELESVFTAEQVPAEWFLGKHANSIAESVVETLDEWLSEDIYSEDEIISLPKDRVYGLGGLITEYLKEHADFHYWGVANVQAHEREEL